MSIALFPEKIESYCGDVLPLQLKGEKDLSKDNIRWSVSGNAVTIRSFEGEKDTNFTNGVLVTLKEEGTASVTAEYEGTAYTCPVTVRKRRTAAKGEPLQYFLGDFHDHLAEIHNHDLFAARESGFPAEYIEKVTSDGRMDFSVISDHAIVTNERDFFRGFTDAQAAQPMDYVVFPGSESEVTLIENDRFGLSHKNSGEIVCVNADNFVFSREWQPFYDALETSPFAVCVLAHPQIVGWDKNGIWNFCLDKNNTPRMKDLVKGVEMGQGHAGCMLYEHTYSVALDCGFRVSVTCSSDCHGPNWGFDAWPGKTVIMAPEKSKEMFLDALLNRRFYATESGNVKLFCTVNGCGMGETLSETETYRFHVEASTFRPDAEAVPVKLQVVSDYGSTLYTAENADLSSFDFVLNSDTARYFYLRFVDKRGRKTWSAPFFTGRPTDETALPELTPLDKSNFTATELLSGNDAGAVINNDPMIPWDGDAPTAEIVIDMKENKEIRAVGHYPTRYVMSYFQSTGASQTEKFAKFAHGYELSVSNDGENYTPCATGVLRIFGGEEYIRFPKTEARYVKFKVTSTIGKASDLPAYKDAAVSISELTIFR